MPPAQHADAPAAAAAAAVDAAAAPAAAPAAVISNAAVRIAHAAACIATAAACIPAAAASISLCLRARADPVSRIASAPLGSGESAGFDAAAKATTADEAVFQATDAEVAAAATAATPGAGCSHWLVFAFTSSESAEAEAEAAAAAAASGAVSCRVGGVAWRADAWAGCFRTCSGGGGGGAWPGPKRW